MFETELCSRPFQKIAFLYIVRQIFGIFLYIYKVNENNNIFGDFRIKFLYYSE